MSLGPVGASVVRSLMTLLDVRSDVIDDVDMASRLVVVFDLSRLLTTVTGGFAATGLGSNVALTVPSGQRWHFTWLQC